MLGNNNYISRFSKHSLILDYSNQGSSLKTINTNECQTTKFVDTGPMPVSYEMSKCPDPNKTIAYSNFFKSVQWTNQHYDFNWNASRHDINSVFINSNFKKSNAKLSSIDIVPEFTVVSAPIWKINFNIPKINLQVGTKIYDIQVNKYNVNMKLPKISQTEENLQIGSILDILGFGSGNG